MGRNINIELEDDLFQKLHEICNGDEKAMKEYIYNAIKNELSQGNPSGSSEESLESYLNKGQSGSRNYGVKGQGW